MKSIYDYLDPIDFISDQFKEIKSKNPNYSLRAWAKQLQMKSHGPLHAILKKQRRIPKSLIPNLIKTLKINKKEAKYFEVLVDFHRSKDSEEKRYYQIELEKISPKPLREIHDLEAYKIITDPIHIILSEITQLKQYQDNPTWIKNHFRINQNLRDLELMLKRLKKVGVIEEQNGIIHKPVEHIYTKYEIQSDVIQNYHKICAQMAIDQISKQHIDEKEFNSIAFNIQEKDLKKIKGEIREFINNLVATYESPPQKGDHTYQLNLHLFSLTK